MASRVQGHPDDVVIAVIGSIGAGKSSFITLISGDTNVRIGNGLKPETSDVQVVRFLDPTSGRNVIIFDTPGFDYATPDVIDPNTLKKITDYLHTMYDEKRKLNGFIYLQSISDNKFDGKFDHNLSAFRDLCGMEAYQKVVVLTTFWDRLKRKEGAEREEQLKTKFLNDLAEGGAHFMRQYRTIQSARQVLTQILTLNSTSVQIKGKSAEDIIVGDAHCEVVELPKAEPETIPENNDVVGQVLPEEQDGWRHDQDYEHKIQSDTQRHSDDIVIAVMGSTGTGKSSFVSLLSGDTSVQIGDKIDSETSDIQVIRFPDPASGRNVIIVDTPGFDDSRAGVTDTDILKKITKFLLNVYDEDRKLNGLIFLQRISDPRFGGQSCRNLRMFRNLCGTKAYQNVVVLTTFWDKVTSKEGANREGQLKTRFKDLVGGGAHFMRHDRTLESARQVLSHVLTLVPTNVQIQEEIRLEGKVLEDTSAGSVRREEVNQIIAKHKEEVADLKRQLEEMRERNTDMRRELEEERAKLRRELDRWESEKTELKKGLDDERKVREKLRADAANERKGNEKWREVHERNMNSVIEAQRKEHAQSMQKLQDQLDQERKTRANTEWAQERRRTDEVARAAVKAERNRPFSKPSLVLAGYGFDFVTGKAFK